jgi:hypothetical protein
MWNTHGLTLPERDAWILRAQHLDDLNLPLELRILIAQYGTSFIILWQFQDELRCENANFHDIAPFNRNVEFPVYESDRFNVLLTSRIDTEWRQYFDLLSDGSWYRRRSGVHHIYPRGCFCGNTECDNRPQQTTRLPRDAYIICDISKDYRSSAVNTIDECERPLIITMHDEESTTGILKFSAGIF